MRSDWRAGQLASVVRGWRGAESYLSFVIPSGGGSGLAAGVEGSAVTRPCDPGHRFAETVSDTIVM